MTTPASMTVFIPLAIRKRNGRAKIMPPAEATTATAEDQSPHVLRAIARAWAWRRRMESGEASTLLDIAQAEGVTDRFVSHLIRLAYLSPNVLEKLVLQRGAPMVSLKDVVAAADLPWNEQQGAVFG